MLNVRFPSYISRLTTDGQILLIPHPQIARRANLSHASRLCCRANHHDILAHPAPMKRDVSADRHDTWGGDAMDADGTRDERGGGGRQRRVGLAP